MKKLLLVLVSISFLGLMVAPIMVLAQVPPAEVTGCKMRHDLTGTDWEKRGFICAGEELPCEFTDTDYTCGTCCLLDTIYTVTDWIFIGVAVIAMIFVLLGAYNIVTAGGVPEKVAIGKNYILYAVIGFILALIARAIPSIARSILGM